jgi:hypothetical protein
MSDIQTVADMPEDYSLITGSHERNHVLKHIGETPEDWSHGSLFVTTLEGEYDNVLFFSGNVPYLHKDVTRIR